MGALRHQLVLLRLCVPLHHCFCAHFYGTILLVNRVCSRRLELQKGNGQQTGRISGNENGGKDARVRFIGSSSTFLNPTNLI